MPLSDLGHFLPKVERPLFEFDTLKQTGRKPPGPAVQQRPPTLLELAVGGMAASK
jgi:hypothetical protein